MPVLTKDIGLPDIKVRLPDAGHAKPDIRLPDVQLPKLEAPKVDLGKFASVPSAAAKIIAEAASGLPIGQKRRRGPRRLAAVALIAAGLAGWALATNHELRARVGATFRTVWERVSTWLADYRTLSPDVYEPVAFQAAQTEPIKESPFAPDTNRGTPDYPEGLGSPIEDTSEPSVSAAPSRTSRSTN